jgi:hypothetical protein
MQTNHLSHFLLIAEIWSLLEIAIKEHGEARVVNHSRGARNSPKGDIAPLYLRKMVAV